MVKPELHLPDLPEVEVALGADAAPPNPLPGMPWPARVRAGLSAYLPLLLMLALALATWWLVQHTPTPPPPKPPQALRHEPDYEMSNAVLQRYAPDGRLVARIEGDVLRHYPDTDEIEIDTVQLQGWSVEGRKTVASARSALASGDASEFRLLGGARVTSDIGQPQPLEVTGEFLQVFVKTQRLFSDRPVVVTQGARVIHAEGMDYDHRSQIVRFSGRVRGTMEPLVAPPQASAPSSTKP